MLPTFVVSGKPLVRHVVENQYLPTIASCHTPSIEQCGNRIVDCGGGTIADARADGTEENGVHDVSVFDYTTPIHVIATYEDGAFVLRPVGIPGIEVRRELDADGHMIWTRPDMGGIRVVLERVSPPK